MPIRRKGELGKVYEDGEVIIHEGDMGDSMFVVQSGEVEVVRMGSSGELRIGTLSGGDFFGEMALFDKTVRSATVRAVGEARVLTIDKRTILKRISEDPLLAVNLLKSMSSKLRSLNEQVDAAR
ncbi:MAG: cyclic nucleotide-binding domain-containing protein [Acidimicrobiia bacterium]|nr:cyclic nucleotide-binding domain-containing protein [Acidimicrobiia bacterium]